MEHKERKAGAKGTIVQFIQFGFVGVLNTLVDFLVFQALNLLAGWTYLAQVVGYSCGVVNSYLWNSNWTSLPGYELAGASVNLHLSSKAIPASVVLEMTNLISGCSASAM